MKKISKLLLIPLIILLSMVLTGCTKTIAYTYAVETGDNIRIELYKDNDTSYKLSSDVPFTISKDDKTLSTGSFLTSDGYDSYKYNVEVESHIEIFKKDETDDLIYTFFSVKNEKFIYLIKVKNSNTGIILENDHSKKEAKEVFDMIGISLVNNS